MAKVHLDMRNIKDVFNDIEAERVRQDVLKAEGRFRFTLDDPRMDDLEKLACVLEELAEVGKAMLGKRGLVKDGGDPKLELIQVAALAVAWLQGEEFA